MALGKIMRGLGKIQKLGAYAAAPFTGGQSLRLLPVLEKVGGALGRGAQASKAGRQTDALTQAQINQANNRAGLEAANFNLAAPSTRANQVARGEVLATMQDAPLLGDPRVDKWAGGGLRPSAFGAASRQAGSELSRQALQALMSGERFTPEMTRMEPGGAMERIGGAAGLAGGIAGALGESGALGPLGRLGRGGFSEGANASGIAGPIPGLPVTMPQAGGRDWYKPELTSSTPGTSFGVGDDQISLEEIQARLRAKIDAVRGGR